MNWATSEITVSTVITRSRSRRSATSDLTVLLRTGKDGAEPQKAPSHNSPRGRAPKNDATLGAFLLTTRDTPARKAGIVWALLAFLGGVLSDPAETLLWPDPDQWPAWSWCMFNAEWGAVAHGHRPLWRPRSGRSCPDIRWDAHLRERCSLLGDCVGALVAVDAAAERHPLQVNTTNRADY